MHLRHSRVHRYVGDAVTLRFVLSGVTVAADVDSATLTIGSLVRNGLSAADLDGDVVIDVDLSAAETTALGRGGHDGHLTVTVDSAPAVASVLELVLNDPPV